MNDFEEYFKAGEPGRRERAEAWATAIGLQQVDGLVPSQFLFNTAIEHIEGRITQNQARRRIRDYYAAQGETTERDPDKEEADKVSERIVAVIKDDKRKIRELSEGARKEGCQEKVVRRRLSENGSVKTADKLLTLLKGQPHLTQEGMARAMGISRQAIQKHLARFKASGRLRRVGPDKGGHWEVVE
ncbi:MAG: HTH domain-containing protein [Kiritimatiellae bacterium]|nr:HTH domain-containing protein [Kiritimatiellia bacterium]